MFSVMLAWHERYISARWERGTSYHTRGSCDTSFTHAVLGEYLHEGYFIARWDERTFPEGSFEGVVVVVGVGVGTRRADGPGRPRPRARRWGVHQMGQRTSAPPPLPPSHEHPPSE